MPALAPPPSLRFTENEVILSLSPPTPGPLAPGQERHPTTGPENPKMKAKAQTTVPYTGNVVGVPLVGNMTMPIKQGNMGKAFGRGRGFPQQQNQGYGRAGNFHGKGMKPSYQPYPQSSNSAPYNKSNNMSGTYPPRHMNNPRQPFPSRVMNTAPQHLSNYQYPPNQKYPPQPPPPPLPPQSQFGSSYPPPLYRGQTQPQSGSHGPPQIYHPVGQPLPTPPVPQVPFEVLYPMHGKKAPAVASSTPLPPAPGIPFQPPNLNFNPTFQSHASPFQSTSPTSFQNQASVRPLLPTSPPPPTYHTVDASSAFHSGHRADIRIITEDVVSPVVPHMY
jgi:hypothetical protein